MFLLLCLLVWSQTAILVSTDNIHNATWISTTRILVNSDSHYAYCINTTTTDGEISCNSLEDALDLISTTLQQDRRLFDIILNSSMKYIINKPISTTASVHISSPLEEKPAIVLCNYSAEFYYTTEQIQHTLYFNRSYSVLFSNIIMEGCPLPIRIDASNSVIVEQSLFRYFSEAVFDIHNCLNVTVINCTFANNTGSGIIKEQYRGNTGALSVTYNYMDQSAGSNPFVNITNCNFTNNLAGLSNSLSSDQTFGVGVLLARGGGMAVFVQEHYFNISAQISHCRFSQNKAQAYGGGMYILFNGAGSHNAMVDNNYFLSNTAISGGGGLIIVGVNRTKYDAHSFTVRKCRFESNFGAIGGGLYYSINLGGRTTSIVHFEECEFIGNGLLDADESFGAAIVIDIADYFEAKELIYVNSMKDCLFDGNTGENSIVSIGLQIFNLSGTNRFVNNKGLALRIVGTTVILGGVIEFVNNSATDGAAVNLLSLSQMMLDDNLQLLFQNNRGKFGSSIFVSGIQSPYVFEQAIYNPQCFIQLVSDQYLSPSKWDTKGINVTFSGNIALFGSAIYAASLTQCSWISNKKQKSFDLGFFPKWPIFYIRDDNRNEAFSDQFDQKHSVVTNAIELDITMDDESFRGWPGQRLRLSIQPLDEFGNPTGALSRIYYNPNDKELDISIDNNTLLISKEIFNESFAYSRNDKEAFENINGELVIDLLGVSNTNKESSSRNIPFYGENCIGGYSLLVEPGTNNRRRSCQCDPSDNRVILCEQDQDSIIIKDGQWAFQSSKQSGSLFFYLCPSGYCRCFLNASEGQSHCVNVYTNSYTDRQCVCSRKGILCGECANKSMTAVSVLSNKCTTCENAGNIILIPVLILLVFIIVGIIVLVDISLPDWMYPFLFYLQIAPLASLHFPLSFIAFSKYLMYIGSSLSLYFPYDFCVHNELSAVGSYGLKYIPSTVVVIVALAVIPIRYLIFKCLSKCSLHYYDGNGVWTVLLLVFTQTLHTSAIILHCPSIPNETGNKFPRWYLNGSLECFTNGHLPLAVFAILWGTLSIVLIPTVIILSYKESSHLIIVRKLSKSLKKPYKHNCSLWYGIELSRRFLTIAIISFFPDNSILLLLFIMILVVLYGYCKPYANEFVNIIEVVTLITFLMLLILRVNHFIQDMLQVIIDTPLTSIPSCNGVEFTTVTIFAGILLVIYYTPVVFGLLCLSVWIVLIARKSYLKIKQMKQLSNKSVNDYSANINEDDTYIIGTDDHIINTTSRSTRKISTTVASTELEVPLL